MTASDHPSIASIRLIARLESPRTWDDELLVSGRPHPQMIEADLGDAQPPTDGRRARTDRARPVAR